MLSIDGVETIRFERAAFVQGGQVRNYLLFERHLPGSPPIELDANCAEGPIYLRLERQGKQLAASFIPDGVNWQRIPSHPFGPRKATVGIAAVNTSSKPMQASQ